MSILYAQPAVAIVGETIFTPPDLVDFTPDVSTEIAYDGDELGVIYSGSSLAEFAGRGCYQAWAKANPATATNEGYLANILDQDHYSVLEHASITFYLTGISRSLSHELVRHRHFSFSQLSQRYVDSSDVKFVIPPEIFTLYLGGNSEIGQPLFNEFEKSCTQALESYRNMADGLIKTGVARKVARQTARSVLPNATETQMTITGNYRTWIEFIVKRDAEAADAEIRRLAQIIAELLADKAPNVFAYNARKRWDMAAQQGVARH